MTVEERRKEIREGLERIEVEWYGEPPDGTVASPPYTFVGSILKFLTEQGVVMKVEKEFPIERHGQAIITWAFGQNRLLKQAG